MWDRAGHFVEEFGLFDNLMIACAIQEAGGTLTMVAGEGERSLAAFQAFESCLEALRSRFA